MSQSNQWDQTLEAAQRRAEELSIIYSIQQGLSSELDFQSMVDLVGDQLRGLFKTHELTISWYDPEQDLVQYIYCYEHGKRLFLPPRPPPRAASSSACSAPASRRSPTRRKIT